jgi:hypothetical protein
VLFWMPQNPAKVKSMCKQCHRPHTYSIVTPHWALPLQMESITRKTSEISALSLWSLVPLHTNISTYSLS